jgi:uncharacterized membrane protein
MDILIYIMVGVVGVIASIVVFLVLVGLIVHVIEILKGTSSSQDQPMKKEMVEENKNEISITEEEYRRHDEYRYEIRNRERYNLL